MGWARPRTRVDIHRKTAPVVRAAPPKPLPHTDPTAHMNAFAASRYARPVSRSLLLLALVLSAARVYAQTAVAPATPVPSDNVLQLDKFVTTGSVTPRTRL